MRNLRYLIVLLAVLCPLGRTYAQQTLSCSSDDGKKHYCQAETRAGVQMVKQRSGSPCTQGVSWDYDDRGIWVDKVCRADFLLSGNAGPDSGGGPATVTCSSNDGGRQHCPADTHNGVQMTRQISGSKCTEGKTWGFDQSGIWVDKGCRAEFSVGGGYSDNTNHGDGNNYGSGATSRTVSCASNDGKRHYCAMDTSNARINLLKQRSGASCVEGTTWGFDSRGIWVDKGCRADFTVESGGGYGTSGGDSGAQGRTCTEAVGADRANQLVQQCTQVSPATHPPCNAQNTCKLITDEIKRSCQLLAHNAPGFCDEYR